MKKIFLLLFVALIASLILAVPRIICAQDEPDYLKVEPKNFFKDSVSEIEVSKITLPKDAPMQVYNNGTFPIVTIKAGEVWISKNGRGSHSQKLLV